VANLVDHTDVNCQSVLQFAIDVLKVKHVIVCGHYSCGGILAAMSPQPLGLIDNWLRNIRDLSMRSRHELEALPSFGARADRLAELNVETQVANVCYTSIVQAAWARGQELTVNGWIYSLKNGLLRELVDSIASPEQIAPEHRLSFPTPGRSGGG
jgi:carbonic anhydrase